MIRVLQVVNNMHRAGLETMLMNYYRHMDREKIQFDFLTHRPERDDYDETRLVGKGLFSSAEYIRDYFRYRTFEFAANEIIENKIGGEIAELGVFRGTFSALINEKFKDRVFIKNIMSKIQKKYKEIKVDSESCKFSGIVKGKFVSVKISPRFFKKTADLKPIYLKYGYELTVKKKKDGEPYTTTIGGFLDESIKCKGDILFRYKGLGELDGKELWKTTMDINNRVSVQYTVEDVERELEIFNMTHGKSTNDVKRRKEMMKKFKIDREDLDN